MPDQVRFDELPAWLFEIEETSMGLYRLAGKHRDGARLSLQGTDPEVLFEEARRDARELETQFGPSL